MLRAIPDSLGDSESSELASWQQGGDDVDIPGRHVCCCLLSTKWGQRLKDRWIQGPSRDAAQRAMVVAKEWKRAAIDAVVSTKDHSSRFECLMEEGVSRCAFDWEQCFAAQVLG